MRRILFALVLGFVWTSAVILCLQFVDWLAHKMGVHVFDVILFASWVSLTIYAWKTSE